uniref:Uncharacterized protein n=1 Tax=Oryza sativa subsp. japonica TaxID=39947 RepID=Q6EUA7_ORYSJ|nr:hypothetical protein [Oryza sativa Japonica Group]
MGARAWSSSSDCCQAEGGSQGGAAVRAGRRTASAGAQRGGGAFPANSNAIDVGGGRMVIQPTEHMPMAQPLIPGLQIDGSNRSTATGSHWRHHRHLDGRVLLPGVGERAAEHCPELQ